MRQASKRIPESAEKTVRGIFAEPHDGIIPPQTVPDLAGFAAAYDFVGKSENRNSRGDRRQVSEAHLPLDCRHRSLLAHREPDHWAVMPSAHPTWARGQRRS
jgi:hypothetical protein